jgi:hypothetical protein
MKSYLSPNMIKWGQFIFWFTLIWIFILLSPLMVREFPSLSEKLLLIREKNINANALFYTETPQATEAGIKLNHR